MITDERLVSVASTPAHLAFHVSRGRWAFPRWLQYLNDEVTDFVLGKGEDFLAVEAPVRHGKSRHLSVFTAAWAIGMNPKWEVMHMSYSVELSKGFTSEVRDIIEEFGPALFGIKLAPGWKSAYEWKVCRCDDPTERPLGGMRSVTKGRTITGTGADLIIIDDPVKNAREADSKLERDRLWDWYTRTLRNRLEPGGKILLVMARWHEDDLVGRLFDSSYVNEKADQWRRIHLPALAEPAPWELDDKGMLLDGRSIDEWTDCIGRHFGEPLWPERYSLKRLMTLQASVGPRGWTSNFQQRPTATATGMFAKTKWRWADALPAGCMLLRYWDLAASVTGDWVAGVLLGMDVRGRTYIVDVARMRGEPDDVEAYVTRVADADAAEQGRGRVHHVVEQEPGSGGKFQAHAYISGPLAKHSAEMKGAGGSKVVMAGPFAGQVGVGNVHIVQVKRGDGELGRPEWYPDFAEEAAEFPNVAHDDQIDSATKAYVHLRERWEKRRAHKAKASSVASRKLPAGNAGSSHRR